MEQPNSRFVCHVSNLIVHLGGLCEVLAAVYDGDTRRWLRMGTAGPALLEEHGKEIFPAAELAVTLGIDNGTARA